MLTAALLVGACLAPPAQDADASPPNVILVFTDDQGYGDVGCFGAKDIDTPHLDRMAAEGMRFTDFHVSQAICSASRAAILTGCYSERVGIRGALGPGARIGLHPDEETIADVLKARGYATAMVGKWHLGHRAPFLPTRQGFDESFGLPYSNDMWAVHYDGEPLGDDAGTHRANYPALRLFENDEPADEVRTLADQAKLIGRYTDRAVDFIERSRERPFFLYLAHSLPHVPLGEPLRFAGRSERGPYGDVIEEIDDSMGRILATLDENGLRENTLVVFTSDNGPWLNYGDHAGSAGPLREGKATAWEGGNRVPCIVRWPGRVPAGRTCDELAATIDLLPTFASLASAALPERTIDGVDLTPLLEGEEGARPRRTFRYYYDRALTGIRRDEWKLVFPHEYRTYLGVEPGSGGFPGPTGRATCGLELYDLNADPGETTDVSAEHPEIVRELEALAESVRGDLGDRLRKVRGANVRPPGRLAPKRKSPVEHLAIGRATRLSEQPATQYAAKGAASLVDGVLGSEDFDDGQWLGFRESEVEAVIDLGEPTEIGRVACSFLQNESSWIFLPSAVEFAVSADGAEYTVVRRRSLESKRSGLVDVRTFAADVESNELGPVRYVRVRAIGIGPCPDWHPGKGEASWLFVDEIVVE